jgi:hypothetical protein
MLYLIVTDILTGFSLTHFLKTVWLIFLFSDERFLSVTVYMVHKAVMSKSYMLP